MSEELTREILAHGPIHKLTVEFEPHRFRGEILPELDRLKELGIIRVIDMLAVRKDPSGRLAVLTASDLRPDEAVAFGSCGRQADRARRRRARGRRDRRAKLGAEALADGHVFDPDDAPAIAELMRPRART